MPLETHGLYDCAVLWAKRSGRDGIDSLGRQVLSDAVQIPCRFQYITRLGQNVQQSVDLVVAKMQVCQIIPTESIVWDGKLNELPADLSTITNLMIVLDQERVKDIKYREEFRLVTLGRYNDTLPTIGT